MVVRLVHLRRLRVEHRTLGVRLARDPGQGDPVVVARGVPAEAHQRLLADDAERLRFVGGAHRRSLGPRGPRSILRGSGRRGSSRRDGRVEDVRDAVVRGRRREDRAHGEDGGAQRGAGFPGHVRGEAHDDAALEALLPQVVAALAHHLHELQALVVALPVEPAQGLGVLLAEAPAEDGEEGAAGGEIAPVPRGKFDHRARRGGVRAERLLVALHQLHHELRDVLAVHGGGGRERARQPHRDALELAKVRVALRGGGGGGRGGDDGGEAR